jgi:hypothetical protein
MSLETSKRALAKATARDLEDFKKWLGTYSFTGLLTIISSESVTCSLQWYLQLDIDPVTAKTPFFAPENATKWAVSEQWHTFWTKRRQEQRHALSQSGAATSNNGSLNHVQVANTG